MGLLLEQWPADDRVAWQRATTSKNAFDDTAVAASWRPRTRQNVRYAYARWLANLQECDPSALASPLALRVTPERLRAYVARLAVTNGDMGIAAQLQHLSLALGALSRETDWTWLRQAQYAFAKRAQPRDKRQKMVDPRRLVNLGDELMDRAEEKPDARESARQYRDGLIIALLIRIPLRRKSMAAISLGRNLRQVGCRYRIELHEDDTKAGHPVEFDVPELLTPRLKRYLTHFRECFPGVTKTTALWVSSKGGPLGADSIYRLVSQRTADAFGFAIYPHLFRDIAVTAIARESPESLHVARDLLTHARFDTTDKYYVRTQSARAARSYAEDIAALRSRGGR